MFRKSIFDMNKATFAAILASSLLIISCDNDKFKINGEIAGASDESLILERGDFNGRWYTVDSTRTNSNGDFSISFVGPENPDIYRLRMGDNYIYIPIDSVHEISLTSDFKNYGVSFKLTGSPAAEKMEKFEKGVATIIGKDDNAKEAFKRKVVNEIILPGNGDLMSYYVLTKIVDGKALFSVEDPKDVGYIGAVATAYQQFKPNDPRTNMLEQMALTARRNKMAKSGKKRVVEASEVALIDIELPDVDGNTQKLSDYTSTGKPTVVIFSLMNTKDSPAFNKQIANIYNTYGQRVNFYHVCLDSDRLAWREAARNLPWTVVIDPAADNSTIAMKYNVSALPSVFIYNSKGELSKRVSDIKDLSSQLASY